jgi:hypothetical protein
MTPWPSSPARIPVDRAVLPGEAATFRFEAAAPLPEEDGHRRMVWRMTERQSGQFGHMIEAVVDIHPKD